MKTRKYLDIFIKVAIPVIVLIAVLFFRFKDTARDSFSIEKYALVSVVGVDGRGEASFEIDVIGLMNATVGNEATKTEKMLFDDFVNSIHFNGDKIKGLSNGDTIAITAQYDEELAKKLNIRTGTARRKYKVSGLNKGTKLDVFQDVNLITNGVSPFISVTYENNSNIEYLKGLTYEISRDKGNAKGDEVTITCKADIADAAEHGYYFDNLVKKYVIDNVDRYANKPEDIDKSVIDEIVKDAVVVIEDLTNDTTSHITYEITGNKSFLYRDGNEEAVNFSLYKAELASNITKAANKHQNYLLVYVNGQIRVPDYSGNEDPYEYIDAYFCFVYCDAIITTDGQFTMKTDNISQRYICSGTYEETLAEAMSMIGSGFEYVDVITK